MEHLYIDGKNDKMADVGKNSKSFLTVQFITYFRNEIFDTIKIWFYLRMRISKTIASILIEI